MPCFKYINLFIYDNNNCSNNLSNYFWIIYIYSHGLMIGHIKGNAVKVSNSQFPEVYKAAENLSYKIGLESIPDIYVLQSGGMINAFATRFAQEKFCRNLF